MNKSARSTERFQNCSYQPDCGKLSGAELRLERSFVALPFAPMGAHWGHLLCPSYAFPVQADGGEGGGSLVTIIPHLQTRKQATAQLRMTNKLLPISHCG